jgi:hypothetical protein
MTDTSNPWTNPDNAQAEARTNRITQAEAQAQQLAADRLAHILRVETDKAALEARVANLEDAIRFALSKVDRRTSYAKRLYFALNDTTRSVVPPNVKA